MPITRMPRLSAVRTTARTAAFMPGASPPLVRTPMVLILVDIVSPSLGRNPLSSAHYSIEATKMQKKSFMKPATKFAPFSYLVATAFSPRIRRSSLYSSSLSSVQKIPGRLGELFLILKVHIYRHAALKDGEQIFHLAKLRAMAAGQLQIQAPFCLRRARRLPGRRPGSYSSMGTISSATSFAFSSSFTDTRP